MRRLRKTCLVTLLLVSSSFQFDRFIAAQSPQSPQQRQETAGAKAPAAEQKQPDYSQEAYVIERMATSYRFEKDGTGQREQTFRVKVQSDAGVESFGQLVFPYSSANEKLDIEHVSVRKPDGSEVKAQASAVQDLTAPISREAPVLTPTGSSGHARRSAPTVAPITSASSVSRPWSSRGCTCTAPAPTASHRTASAATSAAVIGTAGC
jgi:hypothetical protein